MTTLSARTIRRIGVCALLALGTGCPSGSGTEGPDSGATGTDTGAPSDTASPTDDLHSDTDAGSGDAGARDADACRDGGSTDPPESSPGHLVATDARGSTIDVDGRLDGPAAAAVEYEDTAGDSDNSVEVRARWTADALYLGADVTDEQVESESSAGAWENDSFEVAFDPDANGGASLEGDERKWLVDVDDATRGARAEDGNWVRTSDQPAETAVRETDDGYAVELRIPWDEIGGFSAPDTGEAPNVFLITNDRDDGQLRRFSWTGPMEDLQTPSQWGTLELATDPCRGDDSGERDAGPTDTSDAADGGDDAGDPSDSRLGPPRYVTESDFDFRTTLHAVDDLDMDPDGNEAIDDKLEAARDSHTLIEFPPGKYKIEAGPDRTPTHNWGGEAPHFGIKGLGDVPKDVQFVVEPQSPNYGGRWIDQRGGEGLMIKNVAIQMNWDDNYTSADIALRLSDLLLFEKVEWAGLMPNDDNTNGMLFHAHITDTDGVGELNRVYIREGAMMPDYPDGAGGIRIGPSHRGTLYATDLWMENNASSAIRFSKCPGRVGLEGGFFKNNANTNLRGGAGNHPDGPSYMRGATVVLDTEDTNDYQPDDQPLTTTHGLRVDSTRNGWTGLIVEDIDIYFLNPPPNSEAFSRPTFGEHGAFVARDVRIKNETSRPSIDIHSVPPSDDTARFENIHVTGSGGGPLRAASGTTAEIVDSCVESNVDIRNFDTVDNVDRSNCQAPTAPTDDPHEH